MATMMVFLSALAAEEDGNDNALLSALEAADNGNKDEVVVSAGLG